MTFNPKEHLIKLRGKDYLETKWRIAWFRDDHPQGQILTELVSAAPVIMKAVIQDGDGRLLSTGYGSAQPAANAVWSGREVEKAETAAIGRALAHAGYGTQFTDEDETENLADSPVEAKPKLDTETVRQQLGSGSNGRRIPPPEQKVTWDTPDILTKFLDKCRRELAVPDMTASEVAKLAQVGSYEDLTDWRIYDNPYTAFDAVKIAFERGLEEKPAKAKKTA